MTSTQAQVVRYATVVTKVGPLVPQFAEHGMLVFFGENAPEELHDMSVLHRADVQTGGLVVGDVVVLDDQQFPILAVGDVVNDNLVNLGHIDLKFNGQDKAALAGDVCLPKVGAPMLAPGSVFRIVSDQ